MGLGYKEGLAGHGGQTTETTAWWQSPPHPTTDAAAVASDAKQTQATVQFLLSLLSQFLCL